MIDPESMSHGVLVLEPMTVDHRVAEEDDVILCHEYSREIVDYSRTIRDIVVELALMTSVSPLQAASPDIKTVKSAILIGSLCIDLLSSQFNIRSS